MRPDYRFDGLNLTALFKIHFWGFLRFIQNESNIIRIQTNEVYNGIRNGCYYWTKILDVRIPRTGKQYGMFSYLKNFFFLPNFCLVFFFSGQFKTFQTPSCIPAEPHCKEDEEQPQKRPISWEKSM